MSAPNKIINKACDVEDAGNKHTKHFIIILH